MKASRDRCLDSTRNAEVRPGRSHPVAGREPGGLKRDVLAVKH